VRWIRIGMNDTEAARESTTKRTWREAAGREGFGSGIEHGHLTGIEQVKPTPRFPERTQLIHLPEKQETNPRPDPPPEDSAAKDLPGAAAGAVWACAALSRPGEREREKDGTKRKGERHWWWDWSGR
jgi:hypothetical protein